MALKDLKLIDTGDLNISKLQENVRSYLNQFNSVLLSGRLINKIQSGGSMIDVTIGTSTTLVPHGLGRAYQGWHLVDIQADARVWRDTSSAENKDLFLPLKASASVVVSLWVY